MVVAEASDEYMPRRTPGWNVTAVKAAATCHGICIADATSAIMHIPNYGLALHRHRVYVCMSLHV